MMSRTRRDPGFTTLELLIAMAVMVVVSSQALSLFASQQRNAMAHQDVVEVQEDSRLAAELMSADVRMAGFMVPKSVAISSVDGGAGGSDILCVSDAGGIDPATLAGVSDRFGGTQLSNDLGAASSVVLVAAQMDIDDDTNDDYAVGGGIIVSDGVRSHCARITSIAGSTVGFTPGTPAGFLVSTLAGRAVPAVVYEVTGNGLLRNGMLFASQIEDVQVEFAVDLNQDGDITGAEFPIHSLDGSETGQVRGVQLSVVARTNRDDLSAIEGQLQALANRAAGPVDTFRRRIVTNTIAPRNLM